MLDFLDTSSMGITSAIVLNTSNELESDVMNELYSIFPSLYANGPLSSLLFLYALSTYP
jgi:hypothetical protein